MSIVVKFYLKNFTLWKRFKMNSLCSGWKRKAMAFRITYAEIVTLFSSLLKSFQYHAYHSKLLFLLLYYMLFLYIFNTVESATLSQELYFGLLPPMTFSVRLQETACITQRRKWETCVQTRDYGESKVNNKTIDGRFVIEDMWSLTSCF